MLLSPSESDEGSHPGPAPGLRVLVADDEAMIRSTIRRLLERRGHGVDEAGDTPEALTLLQEEDYDAVVADINMPGNGRSLVEALMDRGFEGPIIVMTGALPDEVMPDAPKGVILVQKPFDFDEFIRLVEGRQGSGS